MYLDPIAELITKINNGRKMRKQEVTFATSKLKTSILELLVNEGYIKSFEIKQLPNNKSETIVKLKYKNQTTSSINGFRQISKPGLRIYSTHKELPKVLNGLGVAIITTSKGVMSDKQARKENVGGEVIAYIW
ncbi:30S ribosomal protein S8 [Ureaplasma diversum]|uniref:Small ribosomal subunit protein uS8 n=2 Tax=Ureaplasma diversum TaxID=42094 RepID=A0A084F1Q3_9BACT|nr:30S ribosomal protein S8 [Ureaplasma diversum]AJQ45611.1 30S ribosomal protein S8 [Ureaplasma diversum]KEZ24145.1 30S ribosomal protein S8 [Ureaplasma diversum NCTC 246]